MHCVKFMEYYFSIIIIFVRKIMRENFIISIFCRLSFFSSFLQKKSFELCMNLTWTFFMNNFMLETIGERRRIIFFWGTIISGSRSGNSKFLLWGFFLNVVRVYLKVILFLLLDYKDEWLQGKNSLKTFLSCFSHSNNDKKIFFFFLYVPESIKYPTILTWKSII